MTQQLLFVSLFLLSALALSPPALAQGLTVNEAGSLQSQPTLSWRVNILGDASEINTINFTLNFFANDSHQQVTEIETDPPARYYNTEDGGRLSLLVTDPEPEFTITATARLNTDYRNVHVRTRYPYALPPASFASEIPDAPLTQPTPEITARARALLTDETDTVLAWAVLSDWTHNWIAYNLSYGDANYTAAQAYALRQGTCDEYSHLLLALARSANLTGRLATGRVYSGHDWQPHAWVEAQLPDGSYLPIDPTFNEMGQLSAVHLREYSGRDQTHTSENMVVSSYGHSDAQVILTRNFDITLDETQNFAPAWTLAANLTTLDETHEQLTLTLANPTDEYQFIPIELSTSTEVAVAPTDERLVALAPHATATLDYTLAITQALQPNYRYTFPVTIRAPGGNHEYSFQRSTGEQPPAQPPNTNPPGQPDGNPQTPGNQPPDNPPNPDQPPAPGCLPALILAIIPALLLALRR